MVCVVIQASILSPPLNSLALAKPIPLTKLQTPHPKHPKPFKSLCNLDRLLNYRPKKPNKPKP